MSIDAGKGGGVRVEPRLLWGSCLDGGTGELGTERDREKEREPASQPASQFFASAGQCSRSREKVPASQHSIHLSARLMRGRSECCLRGVPGLCDRSLTSIV